MTVLTEYQVGLWLTELELGQEVGFDVRGAVIFGSERVVVWDTLSHPRDMLSVAQMVKDTPLTVVYSHADWDHAWGTAGLPYQEIIAHQTCLERFNEDVPVTLQEKQNTQPGEWDEVVLVAPTQVFQDELTLDLGDVTLVLSHLPGHTRDCIVGLIPAWGVLLAGDTVETPFPILNESGFLDVWLARLETWANDPRVRSVIPAHGPLGGRELIQQNLKYLRGLYAESSEIPTNLSDFYGEVHQANLRNAQKLRPRS
jgi:glyoxylase-like metal-dependent hydrolase (beta-lactamase superfamily II)